MTPSAHASRKPRPGDRLAVLLLMLTGLGEMVFWTLFLTVGLAPDPAPPGYLEYEYAFVVPDLLVACAMLCAAFLRWRGKPSGDRLTVATAGSLVFLGLLDTSFNLQNGIYSLSISDLVSNGLLNAYCVVCGVFLIRQAAFEPEYPHD
jgi:hypothetical protein